MPSLLSMYTSAPKTKKDGIKTKGDIITELQTALKMPYPTVRRKITEETFSYPEKLVICQAFNKQLNELFPEPTLQNS